MKIYNFLVKKFIKNFFLPKEKEVLVNQHIIDYLNHYLSSDSREFAVLLTGKWGCGKSYFINEYIEEYQKTNIEKKIVKISVFGLKNTSQIDEQMFQKLHPILGHRYTKLAGSLLHGAFKLGLKFDLNNDNKPDGEASINLNSINKIFSA